MIEYSWFFLGFGIAVTFVAIESQLQLAPAPRSAT
jgi:hypothetical protein